MKSSQKMPTGSRRKRSAAWKYFKLVDGRAICQISHCATELTWHGSTTALNAHLQSRHSDIMKIHLDKLPNHSINEAASSSSEQTSPLLPTIATPIRAYGLNEGFASISHQEIDQKICEWIATGPRHACAVEDKAFQDLILSLVPNYKVPSAMAVSNMINARYFTMKSNLQTILLNATQSSKISLSVCLVSGWLTLSAHFVTNIWMVSSHVIGCLRFESATQNGDGVAKWINDKLQNISLLPTSIVAIVHSHEESITSGVSMLAEAYSWHSLLCCESVLRFVMDDVCLDQEIVNAINKIEQVVQFLTESEIVKELIKRTKAKHSGNHCGNGTASTLSPSINLPRVEVSSHDIATLKISHALLNVLQPLDATLRYLKKNEFVPSSAIPILLTGMEKKLQSEIGLSAVVKEELSTSINQSLSSSDSMEKQIKTKLLDSLRNLTAFNANDVTTLAAALDPRYKKLFFISSDERQAIYSMISAECFFLYKDEPKCEDTLEDPLPKMTFIESTSKTSSCSIMDDIMRLGSGCHVDEEYQDTSQEILLNKIKKEMDIYFAETPPPNEVNPLGWWRVNQSRFPILAKLAQMYLCIPATVTLSSKYIKATVPGICNHVPFCTADRLSISK